MKTSPDARPETGFTLIEMVITAAIVGLLALAVLPSLSSYRGTSQLRATARQLISDLRAAQQAAIAQGLKTDLVFTTNGGTLIGYAVTQGATVLWQTTLPSQVHATSSWPAHDIAFTPAGAAVGPGSTPAVCLDNRDGVQIALTLVLATGVIQVAQGAGTC